MKHFLFVLLLLLFSAASYGASNKLVRGVSPSEIQPFTDKVSEHLCRRANTVHPLEVDAVYWYKNKTVEIYFSSALSEQPLTQNDIDWIYSTARTMLSNKFQKSTIKIYSDKKPVEQFASKWFSRYKYSEGMWNAVDGMAALEKNKKEYAAASGRRESYSFVKSSKSKLDTVKVSYLGHSSGMCGSSTSDGNDRQWVRPAGHQEIDITKGLEGKNIALWNSHGLFYNKSKNRWTWQRPHLFMTCEEMLTADITLNYLAPMLENAGAYVVIPKERDLNTAEVIVDEGSRGYSEKGKWTDAPYPGHDGSGVDFREGENPFRMGGARQVKVSGGSGSGSAEVCWKPELPKAGEYAVYVSYQSLPEGTTAAYTVHHSGEKSTFYVNQRMGGGTWVYLGTFFFDAEDGGGEVRNGVTLSNKPAPGVDCSGKSVVTADAVKFGGGYGSISRNGERSGVPRFLEGSRYWFQYAGYPENMYSPFDNSNDYKDDYSSRALWVNALSGGSEVNPYMSGYGVPLDLSFALHTDAGLSVNDSIVGTLAIHTTRSNGREYLADGRSRYINRELCDIIQTEVVEDVRAVIDDSWNRRGLWDKSYFECREPEVPAMILELLSHQNLADMRLAMDPVFKFTVARAIYKGILTFFHATKGDGMEVQPLPVTQFSAVLQEDGCAHLKWSPSEDILESSAAPRGYIIYKRVIDPDRASDIMLRCPDRYYGFVREGFTRSTEYETSEPLEKGKVYSYKVVAVNNGGASFPSEILSVCSGERGSVLAVNCFDRLSAPDFYGVTDSMEGGFMPWIDRGVGYRRDISYSGDQISFDKTDEYVDDDRPGFGSSWNDFDTLVACGNTFDYTLMHAAAVSKLGYAFSSCSRSALETVGVSGFSVLDIIGGKQKSGGRYSAVLTPEIVGVITDVALRHGVIIASGAYLLSDPSVAGDSENSKSVERTLKVNLLSSIAPSGVENVTGEKHVSKLSTIPNGDFYSLQRCDALSGIGGKTRILMRYSDYGPAACVLYNGKDYKVMVAGFPLEAADFHHLYQTLSSAL